MTPAALQRVRLAVAKLCGWRRHYIPPGGVCTAPWQRPSGGYSASIPDYPASLDACAQFERGLTVDERRAYADALETRVMFGANPHYPRNWHVATAPPLDRCVALLKLRLPPKEFAEIVKD